ncbi:hypothetical protein WAI453_004598 [Rhynchosporium graminicola]
MNPSTSMDSSGTAILISLLGTLRDFSLLSPELPTTESIPEEIGTFTRFPKLPLELRREIWKLSLPEGSHVGITVGNTCDGDTRVIGSPQEPPSTLRACKDSRVETLSCYTVIPVQRMTIQYPYGLPAPQTLYAFTFNPEADTLYADSSLCFNLPDRSSLVRWLKNLNETNGSVISSITSLEIREVAYEKLWTYRTTFNMFAEMQNTLLTFSGLRVVRFTSMFSNRQAHEREFHGLPDSYCFSIMEEREIRRKTYERCNNFWLVRNSDKFATGKAPAVSAVWLLPLSTDPLLLLDLVKGKSSVDAESSRVEQRIDILEYSSALMLISGK